MGRLSVSLSASLSMFLLAAASPTPSASPAPSSSASSATSSSPTAEAAAKGNPFDASGFIADKAIDQAVESNTVNAVANYRLDGRRYQRFDAGSDVVYLPVAGNKAEVREELAVCPGQLGAFREVLLIRNKLPIDAEIKKNEAAIVAIAHLCREYRLAAPASERPEVITPKVKLKAEPRRETTIGVGGE